MSELTNYVVYFIDQQSPYVTTGITEDFSSDKGDINWQESDITTSNIAQQAADSYKKVKENAGILLETFAERSDNRKLNKWPQLIKAIDYCKNNSCTLVIQELSTLTNNEAFTSLLLNSKIDFHCCDQPFITSDILDALSKHAQVHKELHGKRIREGLQKTSRPSGNPNAAEEIKKVNKSKIDTAIVFAYLIQLIVSDYAKKGYSQRQMVKSLNEEGFTAPEGGNWVLSQLQKVLDRVKLNDFATELSPKIKEYKDKELNFEQIANEFNSDNIASIKRGKWTDKQAKKLVERVDQIEEIKRINDFVLNLLPLIHEYKKDKLSPMAMLTDLSKSGFPVKQTENTIA